MATVNSNTCVIFIDTAGGAVPTSDPGESATVLDVKPIAYSTSAGLSLSNATFEVNYKSATGADGTSAPSLEPTRAFRAGTQSGSLSFEGVVDFATAPTNTVDLESIFGKLKDKGQVTACWASSSSSASAYAAKGYMTSFEMSSSVDDFATFSGTIELVGDISQI